ncbi:hypothetical protein Tdes44962_MAKER09703 [Teratosphaeria destructans]|uniref:Uncharacterized protein n=1 Tax=Teratosphaeria destructans TaxID=418781 RepID=A0A9W7SRR0_9PEZI|nr:hypothetical protein Tdes44962_MAKER09703 [Teratosphaeria destructans]
MLRSLLQIAILSATVSAKPAKPPKSQPPPPPANPPPPRPPPLPPRVTVHVGTCAALGAGISSHTFDPHPPTRTYSGCYSVPAGTGTVMRFENLPPGKLGCVAAAYNNDYCGGYPTAFMVGAQDGPASRCQDGYGIYSWQLYCDAVVVVDS